MTRKNNVNRLLKLICAVASCLSSGNLPSLQCCWYLQWVIYLFQTSLRSIRDCLFSAHRLLWSGWVFGIAAILTTALYYFFCKFLLFKLLAQLTMLLPVEATVKTQVAVVLSLLILSTLYAWLFSALWLKADQVLYSVKTQALAKLTVILIAILIISAHLLGIVVLLWVVETALIPRLPIDNGQTIAYLGTILLVSPLLVRLWYLLPFAITEDNPVAGPWKLLLQGTRGRDPGLFASVLLQALIVGFCYWSYQLLLAEQLQPLLNVLTSSAYTDLNSLLTALQGNFQLELIIAASAFFIVVGPFLSVLAAMQVSALRSFFGAPVADEDQTNFQVHIPAPKDDSEVNPPETSTIPLFGTGDQAAEEPEQSSSFPSPSDLPPPELDTISPAPPQPIQDTQEEFPPPIVPEPAPAPAPEPTPESAPEFPPPESEPDSLAGADDDEPPNLYSV